MSQSPRLRELEERYISQADAYKQSGWFGTPEKWRAHREISLEAVHKDGSFLDVGCANGYLMECMVAWGQARRVSLEPYGLDIGPRLIELARRRLPQWSDRFFVGDSAEWMPPRRFTFVHAGSSRSAPHVERLLRDFVEEGGRLILRSYWRPTGQDPWADSYFDNTALVESMGLTPAGRITSESPGAEFVWLDA